MGCSQEFVSLGPGDDVADQSLGWALVLTCVTAMVALFFLVGLLSVRIAVHQLVPVGGARGNVARVHDGQGDGGSCKELRRKRQQVA